MLTTKPQELAVMNRDLSSQTQHVRTQVVSGLRWTGGSQIVQQLLNLGASVVVARLLVPEDFGLLAMASVFTGIVTFVLDLGLSATVVQVKELKQQQVSSLFWLNVGMGLLMMLIGIACSWPIASFYQNSAVQPIVAAFSCNFFIISLGRTQEALLNREMNFQALAIRTSIGLLAGVAGCILLAFWGFGIWSLVARTLISGTVETVMMWSVSGWRPNGWFRWSEVRELVGFGHNVLASKLLRYIGRNADNLLIGKFVGATSLGYYAMAYNLMMFPVLRFTQVMTGVLFPALSRLQEDRDAVQRGWLRATQLIAVVTTPLMVGLVVLAPQFVLVVYGQKWIPAVPLLQVLAISGLFQSLGQLNNVLLMSLGQVRLLLQLTTLSVTLAVFSFLVGLPYGVIGVASCFVVVNTLIELLFLMKTLSCVGLSLKRYLSHLLGILGAAIGMGFGVLTLVRSLPLSSAPLLMIGVIFGSLIYLMLLCLLAPSVLSQVVSLMPKPLTKVWQKRS